jgi:cell division protein FtsQ
MDGRGRLAQPLNSAGSLAEPSGFVVEALRRHSGRRADARVGRSGRYERLIERYSPLLRKLWLTRGGGFAASALIVIASIGYGVIKGGHLDPLVSSFLTMREMAANTVGFRIAGVAFAGQKNVNREEILARAGITGTTSLLFFDVSDARKRLMADPRIADATILKLYPDRLQITIHERNPFALWQKDKNVTVIASDGAVIEQYVSRSFVGLPFVVGKGADTQAKDFLALLGQYPEVHANVRAAILIAERRWNLRLKNGLDVKLPETDVDEALERLVALDRSLKLTQRDITVLDLRLPDRVTVRMSDAVAQAREAAAKDKAKPKKGGPA